MVVNDHGSGSHYTRAHMCLRRVSKKKEVCVCVCVCGGGVFTFVTSLY